MGPVRHAPGPADGVALPHAVHGGGAEHAVCRERHDPFVRVEIAGHDGRQALVALGDEFVEVFVVGRAQGLESEVVDDEDRDLRQGLELLVVGAGGARRVQVAGELRLGEEQHVVALLHGGVAQRLREVAFTGADGAGDEHRDLLADVAAGSQILHQGNITAAFGALAHQQQVAALDGAAEIGDRDFVTALAAPDVGQQPLADICWDGFPALTGGFGESRQ